MQRNPSALSSREFDVVVIGGGITGSCIARDAARRGLSVALVEKSDFSSATSAGSSKLVHGGLRYLRNLEFGLVRESLRERLAWQRIAPHQVYPLPFLLPVHSTRERIASRAGLLLYDALSFDRNRHDDPTQRLPRSAWLSTGDAMSTEPVLERADLRGAVSYGDCQMYSPERLGLECLIDASRHGAEVANYVTALAFERRGRSVSALVAEDGLSGASLRIAGRMFVNATGPWADLLLEKLDPDSASAQLTRSKGIHIVVRSLTRSAALLLAHTRGHFFVIPWRNYSLIGTTDTPFEGSPDEVFAAEDEIAAFLGVINETLPRACLTRKDVRLAYAALRPLVSDGAQSSYNASRRGEIVDHADGTLGSQNLVSALGGKWTTSRATGETCVDLVVAKLRMQVRACDTATAGLPGAENIAGGRAALAALPAPLPEDVRANLLRTYGGMSAAIAHRIRDNPRVATRLGPHLPDIEAGIEHAFRDEMAMTAADVLFRRTGLATAGAPDDTAVDRVIDIGQRLLGWDDQEASRQRALVAQRLAVTTGE